MAKMTPGPCYTLTTINVQGDDQEAFEVYADDSREQTIAFVFDEARARAIAALPELIEAANGAVRCLSHIKDGPLADPLKYIPRSAYIKAYDNLRRILTRIEGGE